MNTLLALPVRAKVVGLVMIALGTVGALVASQNGLINLYRVAAPGATLADGSYPYPPTFWFLNAALTYGSIALLAGGLLCFVLAKEPDEFFYQARLQALHFALGMQLAIALSLYGFFYWMGRYQMENTYLAILTISFISLWVLFVLGYYYRTYSSSKKNTLS